MTLRSRYSVPSWANGYTLDLDGNTGVAEAAPTFAFANPCGGRSVDDLRTEPPLFRSESLGTELLFSVRAAVGQHERLVFRRISRPRTKTGGEKIFT
jgi:hypothetical protein